MISSEIIKILKENKKNFKKINILCVGDIMMDHYIFGKIERMSPEAPIPIFLNQSEKFEIGGAGNVAKNITSFGAKVNLLTPTGNDPTSKKIVDLVKKNKKISLFQIKSDKYHTPIKSRYITDLKQVIRIDDERKKFLFSQTIFKKTEILFEKLLKKSDLVILSDYDKGFLSNSLIKVIIKKSNDNKKIVIVDPKKKNFKVYSNADIITPNLKEITQASKLKKLDIKQLTLFSKNLINRYKIKNILVTMSEKGLFLINCNYAKKFNAINKKPFDVTGAGDTVIAILSLMIAAKFEIKQSVLLANYAASIVIKYRGAVSTTYDKLLKKIHQ